MVVYFFLCIMTAVFCSLLQEGYLVGMFYFEMNHKVFLSILVRFYSFTAAGQPLKKLSLF